MADNAKSHRRRCVLAYHEVQPSASGYLYRVTNEQLHEHLSFVSTLAEGASQASTVEITFDDGHRSNYEEAFPLLEKYGVKATFFVLAGRIGKDRELMTWEQARALVATGHRVESHGWGHRLFTLCKGEDLRDELISSKWELEDRLAREVHAVSAPGGRLNQRVIEACAKAGYKEFFHSNPWIPAKNCSGLHVQGRHMVTGKMGAEELAALLSAPLGRILLQRAKYAAKEQVRIVLGDQLYHRLWVRLAGWKPADGIEVDVKEVRNHKEEYRAHESSAPD